MTRGAGCRLGQDAGRHRLRGRRALFWGGRRGLSRVEGSCGSFVWKLRAAARQAPLRDGMPFRRIEEASRTARGVARLSGMDPCCWTRRALDRAHFNILLHSTHPPLTHPPTHPAYPPRALKLPRDPLATASPANHVTGPRDPLVTASPANHVTGPRDPLATASPANHVTGANSAR